MPNQTSPYYDVEVDQFLDPQMPVPKSTRVQFKTVITQNYLSDKGNFFRFEFSVLHSLYAKHKKFSCKGTLIRLSHQQTVIICVKYAKFMILMLQKFLRSLYSL